MSARRRTAVLFSGRGSNLKALVEACAAPDYPAEIVLALCNVPGAPGLEIASAAGIQTKVISHKDYATREAFDAALDAALTETRAALVCEAGFMRIHGDDFVRKWQGRLLNIHPSLLPAFKGLRVHQQALDAGVRISGCTVHFIVPELDSGPIIAQAAVPVYPGDDITALGKRVLQAEHILYPQALRLVAEGKCALKDGRAVFAD